MKAALAARRAPAGVSLDDRALGAEFEVIENMSMRAEWERYGGDCNFIALACCITSERWFRVQDTRILGYGYFFA